MDKQFLDKSQSDPHSRQSSLAPEYLQNVQESEESEAQFEGHLPRSSNSYVLSGGINRHKEFYQINSKSPFELCRLSREDKSAQGDQPSHGLMMSNNDNQNISDVA